MLLLISLLGAQAVASPPQGLTAEQALGNYRRMVGAAPTSAADCAKAKQGEEIVVCGRHRRPDPRLPLPDERFGAGEVVRHPGEASSATNAFRGPPREPSKLMETLGKGAGLLNGLITGEDSDFVPPR